MAEFKFALTFQTADACDRFREHAQDEMLISWLPVGNDVLVKAVDSPTATGLLEHWADAAITAADHDDERPVFEAL